MQFDIIIVGGGMVGASLSLALKETDLKIALIDASSIDADHRLIALNFPSVTFFKKLNLWDSLEEFANPIQKIHVSHRGHFGSTLLDSKFVHLPFLGQVIPAKYINQAVYAQLHFSNLTIFQPALLQSLTQTEAGVSLEIQSQGNLISLQSKWLIGADGTHSTVRQLLNIPTHFQDYDQLALVTTTTLARPHGNIAYERFLKSGAIAMLPLTQQRAATIWTDNKQLILDLLQLDDDSFLKALQQTFGYRLGKFIHVEKRYSYPLQQRIAKSNTHSKIYLIGNAAHTVHPVAAQGLNLGLQEVAALADYLKTHPNLEHTHLPAQQFRLKLAHHLNAIFSKDNKFFNLLRATAILGFDSFQPGKKSFLEKSLGAVNKSNP